ncbi:MAG: methylated-DNA--[protein]-cysteine S-methyltransferase, partial [Leptonema sp. (in: Bacteria)]|nr:methylated-DNA--[protein]-cysteine S-methyltransferase [Leptonema sp. (in: bacteria)]
MVEPSNQKVKIISKKSDQPKPEKSEIELLNQTVIELSEYFTGTRQVFTVPIKLSGTEFRKKVWKRLEAIPYGVVKTYGQIAKEVKNPKSSRAVGGACGSNPVAI